MTMTSSAAVLIKIIIPVVCIVSNGEPRCNLELTKLDDNLWVDVGRGITVKIEDNQLVIEQP